MRTVGKRLFPNTHHPFGLSLSKPYSFFKCLRFKEVKPFDRLRANGCLELGSGKKPPIMCCWRQQPNTLRP